MIILRQFKVMRLEIHKKTPCFYVEYVCLNETERHRRNILASVPPSKTNQNESAVHLEYPVPSLPMSII